MDEWENNILSKEAAAHLKAESESGTSEAARKKASKRLQLSLGRIVSYCTFTTVYNGDFCLHTYSLQATDALTSHGLVVLGFVMPGSVVHQKSPSDAYPFGPAPEFVRVLEKLVWQSEQASNWLRTEVL